MKTIILAGGFGTRLSEKTAHLPKSLVEIGGKPILWHIMKHYALYGVKEFVIALGFMGESIKKFFLDFYRLNSNLIIDLKNNQTHLLEGSVEDWKIHLVDTGTHTQTGGRIKRLKEWIGSETFMVTYGDGLSDVNISELIAFHKKHGKLATVTAVHPPARFGELSLCGDQVNSFSEKPCRGWINGGFFVLEPKVLNFIDGDETVWEKSPLESLALQKELMAFKHEGFWHPMDTLKDQQSLEKLYQDEKALWLKKEIP